MALSKRVSPFPYLLNKVLVFDKDSPNLALMKYFKQKCMNQ